MPIKELSSILIILKVGEGCGINRGFVSLEDDKKANHAEPGLFTCTCAHSYTHGGSTGPHLMHSIMLLSLSAFISLIT